MRDYSKMNLILGLLMVLLVVLLGHESKPKPMYWQNGSHASRTGHRIERDLDPWIKAEYIKHHLQKSGAFSAAESTERKKK